MPKKDCRAEVTRRRSLKLRVKRKTIFRLRGGTQAPFGVVCGRWLLRMMRRCCHGLGEVVMKSSIREERS
jgi:hypothetical protein